MSKNQIRLVKLARRENLASVILCLILIFPNCITGCSKSEEKPKPISNFKAAPQPKVVSPEFAKVAETVSAPTFGSYSESENKFEDVAVMFRQEAAYQILKSFECSDQELRSLQRNALEFYEKCNMSAAKLKKLNEKMPDVEGLVSKGLAASPGLLKGLEATLSGKEAVYNHYDQSSFFALAAKGIEEFIKAKKNADETDKELSKYRKHYLNSRQMALRLEKLAAKHYTSKPNIKFVFGFLPRFENNGRTVKVSGVIDNSPASRAGLKTGDVIVAINGQPLSEENYSSMFLSDQSNTREYVFDVRRGFDSLVLKISSTKKTFQRLLSIDLNGSFDGFYSSDLVYASNVSGQKLTNVLLIVTLKGKHGRDAHDESDRHVHFIRNWPPGQSRILRYMSTKTSGIASNESVDQITNIRLKIFSDQYSQTENYIYSSEAFASDVKRYLEDIRFTAKWSAYPKDSPFYDSGVTIKTSDGRSFPAMSVTVTVRSGRRSKSIKWNFKKQIFDGDEYFSDDSFDGMSVERIDLSFDLPYTNFRKKARFDF